MGRFIVISHGYFAKEAVEALRLIMGDSADNFKVVSVTADKSYDEVYQETKELLNKKDYDNQFVFCDIYGGTPFNVALKLYLEEWPLQIYTGFNLPLLLEIAMDSETKSDLIKKKIEDISPNLFKYVNDMIEEE